MMSKLLIFFLFLLLGGYVVGSAINVAPLMTPRPDFDAKAACSFLEAQYVGEAGLLRAAVRAYPDNVTIYVASDNLLAIRALKLLGSNILAKEISTTIGRHYPELQGGDGLHEVILGERIGAFKAATLIDYGNIGNYSVKAHVFNGPYVADWYEYADLVAYKGLNATWSGDFKTAKRAWVNLTNMWDGYGFRDKAFNGSYEAYKLALAYYLARAAGINEYPLNEIVEIMSRLQADNGGVYTHYIVEGTVKPQGDVNTETTSIFVIACLGSPKSARSLDFYLKTNIATLGAMIAIVCIGYILAKELL